MNDLKDNSYKIRLDNMTTVNFTIVNNSINGMVKIVNPKKKLKYIINYDDGVANGILQKYKNDQLHTTVRVINGIIYK